MLLWELQKMKNYVPDELLKMEWVFQSRSEDDVEHLVTANPKTGELACDCKGFYYRLDCWHCRKVREMAHLREYANKFDYEIKQGNVFQVTRRGNQLFFPEIPLRQLDTPTIMATIVFDLLRYGCNMDMIRKAIKHLPGEWGQKDIEDHVIKYGRYVFEPTSKSYEHIPVEEID